MLRYFREITVAVGLFGWMGIALCANAAEKLQGRIEFFKLNSPASGMQADVQVNLPPCGRAAMEKLFLA